MDLLSMDMGAASRSRMPNLLRSVAGSGLCCAVLDLQAAGAAFVTGEHRVMRLAGRVAGLVQDDVAVASP